MEFSEENIDKLIQDIYNGIITIDNLPVNLYYAISKKLLKAFDEFESKPSQELLTALEKNIKLFSGAKVYHQINDISLVVNNEMIKSFSDFKKEALAIFEQYNKNWLQTEYSTTVAQGQNAVRWEQIQEQKKTLPYLKYDAVIDKNTSEICRPLDGICLPVEDKFWNTNSPLNHFNCRCVLIQFDKEDATDFGITKEAKASKISKQMNEVRQPLFNSNSGKDAMIFNDKHPYFDMDEKGVKAVKKLVKNGNK